MQIPSLTNPITALGPKESSEDPKLREAAQGFEALFLTTLLKGGRAGSFGDEMTGSQAVDSTRDMLDMTLAQSGASHSNLGIADAVVRQFAPHVYRKG
jgi:flagellar protein FlgJ